MYSSLQTRRRTHPRQFRAEVHPVHQCRAHQARCAHWPRRRAAAAPPLHTPGGQQEEHLVAAEAPRVLAPLFEKGVKHTEKADAIYLFVGGEVLEGVEKALWEGRRVAECVGEGGVRGAWTVSRARVTRSSTEPTLSKFIPILFCYIQPAYVEKSILCT